MRQLVPYYAKPTAQESYIVFPGDIPVFDERETKHNMSQIVMLIHRNILNDVNLTSSLIRLYPLAVSTR